MLTILMHTYFKGLLKLSRKNGANTNRKKIYKDLFQKVN